MFSRRHKQTKLSDADVLGSLRVKTLTITLLAILNGQLQLSVKWSSDLTEESKKLCMCKKFSNFEIFSPVNRI